MRQENGTCYEYRESGLDWLGKIPAHWEVRGLGSYGKFVSGTGFPHDFQGHQDAEIPFFKVSDTNIPGNEILLSVANNTVSRDVVRRLGAKICPTGTVVFPKVGAALFQNKRRILQQPAVFDNNMMGFIPSVGDERYWYYWLTQLDFAQVANPGAVPSISEALVRRMPGLRPPDAEQRAIADFLDRETARIDQLIEKKQRMVDVVLERQSAVLEQMTFGAEQGWRRVPFKWICRIPNGQVDPTVQPWSDLPLIAPNHIESGTGRLLALETAANQGAISGKYAFSKGTVLYSKIRPELAKACIAPERGLCSADMYPIIPGESLMPEYLLMQLLSPSFTSWAVLESMRVAMPKLNREALGSFRVIVPPLAVQSALVAQWRSGQEKAERLLDYINRAITSLREFRSALITAAVTGQIDPDTWRKRGDTERRLEAIEAEVNP